MWSGLSIFFALLGGWGISLMIRLKPQFSNIILIILILLMIITVLDYELLNVQKTYRSDGSGFIKHGIISRQVVFGSGDLACLKFAKTNLTGFVLGAIKSYSTMQIPVRLERPGLPIFYDISYMSDNNPEYLSAPKQIDYLFFPATYDFKYLSNESLRYLNKKIVCRSDGAKIVSILEDGNSLVHFEAENLFNLPKHEYAYPLSSSFTTIILTNSEKINFNLTTNSTSALHIKYLSSPFFPGFTIEIENKTYDIQKTTKKIEMTEEIIILPRLSQSIVIHPPKETLIPLEIDWFEIETLS